ncbi:hypothetical protein MGG_05398 [Pyricularia oryzae 70-15]|uniref:Uncharacterized protein n=3 Tax=Pyricularia oryzae TaxID=318829 RepID=G4MLB3_PYRO7|nr:uncharacterized protein MGG_05398 [Pyricularia oryzae 70-15]EHA57643.1 hypothetical protein MGG_05398 [Pyricularia oryzae 70-15]ELQ43579.1 hypothetical protein OOU_Y34scaffold00141g2 [Pyricularia oryzae Y34]KAI7910462.1 hypothetical protein M9X92_011096 [Pyricularia oryzae]KAI7914632.1 hypothetical protein M0657_009378 [Pyricularia oryzae]
MSHAAKETFPEADAVRFHGSKAHQSHTNPDHSNVLSFSVTNAKEKRIASGHLHENGNIDWAVAKEKDKDKGKLKTKGKGGSSRSQSNPSLQWELDDNGQVLWWDGENWRNGE